MEVEQNTLPLLSVVIATRNRIPYAISAIQSILEIPDPRLELVVQDNSESRELEAYVRENIKDIRFEYRYTPPPFSSIDNFNAALELATGEYVCLIGDDDGVNPEILEAALWAKENDVDCVAIKTVVSYLWPGTATPSTLFTKAVGGRLQVPGFCGVIRNAGTEQEMRRLVRDGGSYYWKFNLPKLYHGLVHRRCINAINDKTGAYLGGLSPDIFASLAIACVAMRVVVTDYPLTIPGACPESSTVLEGACRRHSTRLSDAPHFRDRGEYHWCELVPRVYTAETLWADSGIAALRAMGRLDLIRQLNLPKLAAYCIGANRGVTRPVLKALFTGMRILGKGPVTGAIGFARSLLTGPGVKFARRVWNRSLMIVGARNVYQIGGLMNMVEASHGLTRHLRNSGRSFADCTARYDRLPGLTHSKDRLFMKDAT